MCLTLFEACQGIAQTGDIIGRVGRQWSAWRPGRLTL